MGSNTAPSTAGEVKASTGSVYRYDDIGNRTGSDEIGRAGVTGGTLTVLTPTTTGAGDVRTTSYGTAATATTANAVNQYTRITRDAPGFFNVRGTRSSGVAIVVNGDAVDNPNSADSGYQQTNTGTFFRDEVPNTAPTGTTSPDLYEPVAATQNGSNLTMDDPVQYVPPPTENLTYDLDGNLLTDGRWTYTWDLADRLVKMVSLPFTQPAAGAVPLRNVKGLTVEFTYDGFSRRIGKKVSELAPGLPGGTAPTLVKWEAYVYNGWNMIATYQRHLTGTHAGKAQKRLATHVWGPDIGSRLEARRDWQAAGGVGGLLMTLYPTPPAVSVISYEDWLAAQGVSQTSAIGSESEGSWIPYEGSYSEPFYDENTGLWVAEYGGYQTPYGFMTYSMASGYSWDYGYYEQAMLGHHLVHVPVMDHMGNVTSVVRLSATPGSGSGSASQREFLYDYDAFGKEQRASALIAGSNPDSYPFHFSTKFTDAETGLVYYGYRFYDPDRGRWINRDPIGEDGGINLYGMVGNSVSVNLDYLGLKCKKLIIDVGFDASVTNPSKYIQMVQNQVRAVQSALDHCQKKCNQPCVTVSSRSSTGGKKNMPSDGTYNVEDPADEAVARQNGRLGEDGHSDNEIPLTITENAIQGRPHPITGARANGMAMASPGNGVIISGPANRGPHGVGTLAHEIGHHAGYHDATNTRDRAHARRQEGDGNNLMDSNPQPGASPDPQWCEIVNQLAR